MYIDQYEEFKTAVYKIVNEHFGSDEADYLLKQLESDEEEIDFIFDDEISTFRRFKSQMLKLSEKYDLGIDEWDFELGSITLKNTTKVMPCKHNDLYLDCLYDDNKNLICLCWIFNDEAGMWNNDGICSLIPESFFNDYEKASRIIIFDQHHDKLWFLNKKYGTYAKIPYVYLNEAINVKSREDRAGCAMLDIQDLESLERMHKINRDNDLQGWNDTTLKLCWQSHCYMAESNSPYAECLKRLFLQNVLTMYVFHNMANKIKPNEQFVATVKKHIEESPCKWEKIRIPKVMPRPKTMPASTNMKPAEYWEYRKNNPLQTIEGAVVLISGSTELEYENLIELVEKCGGSMASGGVTQKTDFLVVNFPDVSYGKVSKAQELTAKGAPIRIISERELLELVENNN